MKKIILSTLVVATLTMGCKQQTNSLQKDSLHTNEKTTKFDTTSAPKELPNYLTYLSSTENSLDYCNGDKNGSLIYRKTITHKVRTNTVIDNMTLTELAKATVLAATSGQCKKIMEQTAIRITNKTAYVAPVQGSAGISIIMCSCRPEIEVNLLQLQGIDNVVFE